MALPNPFQSTVLPSPVLNTAPKTTQNDTTLFHGYRSSFDINQQKQEYEERIRQQAQQQAKFNRNVQQKSNRNENPNNAVKSINYCELCECNFKYSYQLEKHLSEHEKCWYDNCNFEGNSKLLQKHVETQHQSGLFQRIAKIESEEDIEKWREERRKRYPTKANIEARRLAQEERLKRGERIQEPNHRFGSIQNRKSAQQRSFTPNQHDSLKTPDKKKNDRKRRRTRNKHGKEKTTPNDKIVAVNSDSVKSESINDAATIEQCPASPKEKTVPTTNALAAIMGMYGTDSDSDCDDDDTVAEAAEVTAAAKEATTTTITATVETTTTETETAATMSENKQPDNKQEEHVCIITDNVTTASDPILEAIESNKHSAVGDAIVDRKRTACTDYDELPMKQLKIDSSEHTESIDQSKENESNDDDDDAPEEQPIQRQTNDPQEKPEEMSGPTGIQKLQDKKNIDRIPKKRTILDMTRKIRNQNTLLEKLLQKDIRHERNVLLQCVRYVVENNFFGIGQKIDEQNNQIENS